jgi:uncharacterized membrane protein YkoI
MQHRTMGIAGLALAAALALGGGAVALAAGDDGEGTVTGPDADRAAAAALAETGGTVNAVERDSEGGATWEVEVTRPDGTTVDVRLDARYRVVAVDRDGEDEGPGRAEGQ